MSYEEIKKILKNHKDLLNLYDAIKSIHLKMRNYTKKKYNKVNPFVENLFDWWEKGSLYNNQNITIYDSASITGDPIIGNNTWIGPYTSIDASGGLEIGSFCSISAGVRILSHDSIDWALSSGREKYSYAPISIGNNCFLGVNSVITRGTKIGDCCLVAAGAVVTKSFEKNSIIAGIPAKKIGNIIINDQGKIIYEYFSKD